MEGPKRPRLKLTKDFFKWIVCKFTVPSQASAKHNASTTCCPSTLQQNPEENKAVYSNCWSLCWSGVSNKKTAPDP